VALESCLCHAMAARHEHINILELRAALATLWWDTRH